MQLRLTINGIAYDVKVEVLDDPEQILAGRALPQNIVLNVLPSDQQAKRQAQRRRKTKFGQEALPAPIAPVKATPESESTEPTLMSPMPGSIVELRAIAGQIVRRGDP